MRSGREESGPSMEDKKFKGVRRRKWGKWVSEIRVPGSKERLWLGSYTTPEAAAVAHDVAFYCLRRPFSLDGLNFPQLLPASCANAVMSPKSVQKAASDAGMGIDAQMTANCSLNDDEKDVNISGVIHGLDGQFWEDNSYAYRTWEEKELSISVEDYDYLQ